MESDDEFESKGWSISYEYKNETTDSENKKLRGQNATGIED
jgi:hypothetical protein